MNRVSFMQKIGVLKVIGIVLSFMFIQNSLMASEARNAKQLMEQANLVAFYQGVDGRAEARMKIVDGSGREQFRQFTLLRRDVSEGGDQLFYVIFSRPTEVQRTAFLVKKHAQSDDDRWLYLPGLDLVKRIVAGDKRTSFVGSHFFYEDISGRSIADDSFKMLSESDQHYLIEAMPKDQDSVEFTRYQVWLDKKTMLPMKAEYYDRSNKLYRRAEVLKVEAIQDNPTGTVLKMSDLRSGGYTITQMRFVKYDVGLPENVFSERSLRNPPRQWLKRP